MPTLKVQATCEYTSERRELTAFERFRASVSTSRATGIALADDVPCSEAGWGRAVENGRMSIMSIRTQVRHLVQISKSAWCESDKSRSIAPSCNHSVILAVSNNISRLAKTRARRRALGIRSTETILHEREIAALDEIKERFGLASRSDVISILIARTDPNTITPADAAAIRDRAN
ncbi:MULTISPECIES: ribbon-helix-helix domain-containing protein [Aurantimonadaceae]|uniref:Ribbon-helix-helix protein, copG family n=1 Tax=Jiella pelagia TaxID=2986949 RepID=A0ABY7C8X8_9HYPH|nr:MULTISPECIES: hypothetical protein [Aurantimonadaceae]WAP71479.1 hypothetical protein OH818_28005 [Jiella pelagia]